MINVSTEFKNSIANDKRDFRAYLDITLKDGTSLKQLTNENIWQNSLKIDDGVTPSGQFTVGSCVTNKLTATINNIYGDYSSYDFDSAMVVAYIGLELPSTKVEKLRKGVFTVDEPSYDGATITIECLDNMAKFDVDYAGVQTTYPATLGTIVRDICSYCGVLLSTPRFPNYQYVVTGRPDDDTLTCHQVLMYCAQLACCYGRCDMYGRLYFDWFHTEIFDTNDNLDGGIFDDSDRYGSGGDLDGGTFDDYEAGADYDGGGFTDGTNEDTADGGDFDDYNTGADMDGGGFDDVDFKYASGDDAEGGNFTDYSSGVVMDGGTFEDLDLFHHLYSLSGFSVSTDDVIITGVRVTEEFTETDADKKQTVLVGREGYVLDISGNKFIQKGTANTIARYLGARLIGLRFRPMSTQLLADPTIEAGDIAHVTDQKSNTYDCIVTNLTYNLGGYMSLSCDAETPGKNSSKMYSELTQAIVEIRKSAQKQSSSLANVMAMSFGVFKTEEAQPDGSIIYYMHDKPTLEKSDNVWKFTAGGFAVSTDGGKTWNAGFDADGNETVNILSAIGINCDWIHSGTLTLGGINDFNGKLIMVDAVGAEIGRWDVNGLDVKRGKITGTEITLGGQNNKNGTLSLQDASGSEIGRWDVNGLDVKKGNITGTNITIGGQNNKNGTLSLQDASGAEIGRWDVNGLDVKKGNITGTNITIGGQNNKNGTLSLQDASGAEIGRWDVNGLDVSKGKISGTNITLGGDSNSQINMYDTNGKQSLILGQNQIKFYSWQQDGNYIGSIASIEVSGDINSRKTLSMFCDIGDRLVIGYVSSYNENGGANVSPFITLDPVHVGANPLDYTSVLPVEFKTTPAIVGTHNGTYQVGPDVFWIRSGIIQAISRSEKRPVTGRIEFSDGTYLDVSGGNIIGGRTSGGGEF